MGDNCGASARNDAEYSDSDSETDWMPFTGTTPDLPHSQNWDSGGFVSPFQATPVNKIRSILQHLNLSEADVVYDLGCGDGRVLVECSRITSCSGVGIDLDDCLVQRARANAERHNVHRRVTFSKADFLDPQLNFSAATVLFLYLLPDALSMLLPSLEKLANDNNSRLKKIVSVGWPLPGVRATISDTVEKFYIYEPDALRSHAITSALRALHE
ncbi:putative RNA methylase [Toxoplasma gondii TgCatPRC2]|uniref:RNA methylase, putative n=12 Tax=Toxoplasma gondii TaxID=5811 RepID=A0A125YYQ1_TOXGM|nr:RNA methylase, putative [Toxoplasma gondii ME49]EPR59902.1 putative RNA methylase [Toxoplasma gondii GT1]ESS33798.1 putative RNA methylase [Toxoplasma gondii VEG]KFG28878.1 putative RNA methylase [Toxoplasma gondii p89]KFG42820.1 putative RNA methylase [Toxoplasma gondii GAB2-2007-GAL-DOM2]KFG53209.1 putative RNA methylase [Toxoplasma gondii FOU]KFG62575.1 putative RNA methylase [Toxoplasma gondii RUB]KFH08812.1 putative RNA methylase [Toxoplasma gondii VAND]KYF45255.1 putative RNA methy|eukprot:XP_018636365.1 RNA methylase, putative [Toxoplasma gondii ME49]